MKESATRPSATVRIWGIVVFGVCAPAFGQGDRAPDHRERKTAAAALAWMLGDGVRAHWGSLEARIRPRLHFDYVDPKFSDIADEVNRSFPERVDIRRARLLGDFGFRDGTALADWSLRAQVDFADSTIDWKDLVVSYDGLPSFRQGAQTRLRAGHFRESFGLEAMTSVSHLPFIERSAASSAFTPGRSRGVQWSEQSEHSLVQLGWFRRAGGDVFPNELEEETAVTARALWQRGRDPFAGLEIVQLGGSVSVRQQGEDPLRYDARAGSRLLGRVVDSGNLESQGADDVLTFGLESLLQWGQSTVVVEAFGSYVDGVSTDRGENHSFLTGGHIGFFTFLTEGHAARWNPRRGGLRSATTPDALHDSPPTAGAVEAAARLTWVNLDNGAIDGGQSIDLEAGLNFYVQPTTRFMLHWLGAQIDAPGGGSAFGHAILARIQIQL